MNSDALPDLQPLLARVEAASGPDRELDKALWYKLIFDPALDKKNDSYLKLIGSPQPLFTASLDAALALAERVLPGAGWLCGVKSNGGFMAELFLTRYISGVSPRLAYATAKTPALALVIATLRAMIATQGEKT